MKRICVTSACSFSAQNMTLRTMTFKVDALDFFLKRGLQNRCAKKGRHTRMQCDIKQLIIL